MMAMRLEGVQFVGHSDLDGRPEGLQVVGTGDRVFIAHLFSGGFTEVSLTDPRRPRVLSFTAAPPNSWSVHLQVQGDLLLVSNGPDMWAAPIGFDPGRSLFESVSGYAAGVRIYDVSKPGHPREIGFADVGGQGVHRIWFEGSDLAFVSAFPDGFDEGILLVLDLSDPTEPFEVDRYWIPGMGPNEEALRTWPDEFKVSLHHPIVRDGFVYGAWRDGGITVQPVATSGALGSATRLVWPGPDGLGSAAHTSLPLPEMGLVAVAEEGIESAGEPQRRSVSMIDVHDPSDPRRIGTLPSPEVSPVAGARFGPHNLYEYRAGAWMDGSIVFSAHQGAGLLIYRVAADGEATEVGRFEADPPSTLLDPRPGRVAVRQTNDVFVTADGLMAVVDANGGLDILQLDLR